MKKFSRLHPNPTACSRSPPFRAPSCLPVSPPTLTGCSGHSLHFTSFSFFLARFLLFSSSPSPLSPSIRDRRSSRHSLLTMKAAKGKAAAAKASKETLKIADDRKIGKRKAVAKADKSSKRQVKGKKDPNKPKRPPSAFFVFLEEFRKTFKKEHPNVKAVSAVGKAGGEKWKSLSSAEKEPYEAKAAKRKAEYEKQMNAYNKKQESIADDADEESDRSKSEVNDEDEDSEQEEEEEEDEDDED